jgi:uncharacterized protein (TIGR02302 family)
MRLSRLALGWERIWQAAWPAVTFAGLFIALALSDLLPDLNGYLHSAVLAGFALGLGLLLWLGFRGLVMPDPAAARRRIELVNLLPHRPLAALDDELAGGRADPAAVALWELHRQRLASRLGRLRIGLPQGGLALRDPYALRGLVVLLLAVTLTIGWTDAPARLERALTPSFTPPPPPVPPRLDVWVTPPAYTGQAPIFLAAVDPKAGPLKIPESSEVLAQIQGGEGAAELKLGDDSSHFETIGEGTYRATGKIVTGDRLAVVQDGHEIAAWPYRLIEDEPPLVAFTRPPSESERHALRVDYAASDDYGISKVQLTITRRGGGPIPGQPDKIVIELPGAGADPRAARGVAFRDLTAHPWAGTPVHLALSATDATGQIGQAQPVDMILPAREFTHPVAKAIIEQRRQLTLHPESRLAVSRRLLAIGNDAAAYDNDPVVTLALRITGRRLMKDETGAEIDWAQNMLWQTALRLEEGGVGNAEMALRAAEQALQDALNRGASDQEIERLMNQLQEAMNQFLDQLMAQAQRNPNQDSSRDAQRRQMTLDRDSLQRMLDRAREMARAGARDAARQMLSQLQEMLENLRAMPYAQQTDPGARQGQQLMHDLNNLAQRQQELLDRTYRESQQLAPGQTSPNAENFAQDQGDLRQKLNQLGKQFGDLMGQAPPQLGEAEQDMGEAENQLRAGVPGNAVDPQTQALEAMRQGQQAMMEALGKRFGRGNGPRNGPDQDQFGQSTDPLGRTLPGAGQIDTGDVKIPDRSDLQRAREILDELRRRAGQSDRPRYELDYLERLLKRF